SYKEALRCRNKSIPTNGNLGASPSVAPQERRFFTMDFRLTDEQKMIEETAVRFGKKWGPKMEEIQQRTLKEGVFPQEFWDDFAASGFAGSLIPEEYGGSDMGMTALALAMYTMGVHGAGSALIMLTMMDGLCILRAGPDEARQRYLPDIAAG